MGQAPASQARDLETQTTHAPWQRGLLRSVEHAPFKLVKVRRLWDEDSCGGSQVLRSAKRSFFFVVRAGFFGNRTKEARALCGFQHHKGKTCLFLYSDPIIVGLSRSCFLFRTEMIRTQDIWNFGGIRKILLVPGITYLLAGGEQKKLEKASPSRRSLAINSYAIKGVALLILLIWGFCQACLFSYFGLYGV